MTTPQKAAPPLVTSRRITGMSAVLLPFLPGHQVDWPSFDAHVERTLEAGLIPAVNMDTGYVNLLDDGTKAKVLERTQDIASGHQFVAGAFLSDAPDDKFNGGEYARRMSEIERAGGTPVIFQSYGLTQQSDADIVTAYEFLGKNCDQFIGFELGTVFLPFGKIYSLDVYSALMEIENCIGAKHSSLQRHLEWERLALRNTQRPDFMVLTGNDLAIDMVIYGSDYLLGLSSFCPDLFALRDSMWAEGDSSFYQLNDILQYLGFFAFRAPVPAYKHTCAQFLCLRNLLNSDLTHANAVERPESDLAILKEILGLLEPYLS